MFKCSVFDILLLISSLTKSTSSSRLSKRTGDTTDVLSYQNGQGQWGNIKLNDVYTLYVNAWGGDKATSDSFQKVASKGLKGIDVAWSTTYSWKPKTENDKNQVKSYANLDYRLANPPKIGAIKSIPTAWEWRYAERSQDLVANVAYDIWTSSDAKCGTAQPCSTNEIMIWLSKAGGAGPIGTKTDKVFRWNGCHLEAYLGDIKYQSNGQNVDWRVISLVATKDCQIIKNANLKEVFSWLIKEFQVKESDYLTAIGAGSEPFKGQATLETTRYNAQIKV
ncbi:endoglucanase [Melampsora larici-populina 98AG31]|uniref:Endoglucanase n=1 Tax=Melampsora larici-populina (strain 98AG31 / pathotype 3-4-7) TaxID=747676 RepID=F4RDJ2_MELLP|nr:endoglucanase [Melampsora larici-populina 98AG31]EGG09410.1 endoglucanase [Melampsora larici-populina 98AG31]